MKLDLSLRELWCIIVTQFALVGIADSAMHPSFSRQVYLGYLTLCRLDPGVKLDSWLVDCSEADLLHLAKYTDPQYKEGAVMIGESILLKVFTALGPTSDEERTVLPKIIEDVLEASYGNDTDPGEDANPLHYHPAY